MNTRIFLTAFIFISSVLSTFSQDEFFDRLADAALSLTGQPVTYDPAYYALEYPGGDIPSDRGVCTDVIIRAYRAQGVDLQEMVHEDMQENFGLYPNNWGLAHPDKNIDHRRVPNLMVFFSRLGEVMENSENASDYQPGDIVCWDLGAGVKHIGIVVRRKSENADRYMVVHNIGTGQVLADCLFDYKIIGHYRFGGC